MQQGRAHDAELIDAAYRGDQSAFAQIVERYRRAVYAVSLSYVHDRALCDDLTQDTFVLAWLRLSELRDPARLPAWLCGIARNLARDARKRRRFESGGPTADVPTDATPFDALSSAESDRLLAAALDGIPEKYREPLVLFYCDQRSATEVAHALGIREDTAHQRLSRGRRYLRDRMTAMVEHGLARRGPRPELVAGVLAAIGALLPSSHLDARPLPRGSTMPARLTAIAITVVTVGAVGALSANGGPKSPPTSHANARPPATPPTRTNPAAPARATAPTGTPAAAVMSPATPRLPAATATVDVPTCEAVATHMSDLAMSKLDASGTMDPKKRAILLDRFKTANLRECTGNRMTESLRLCLITADDYERARIDCSDEDAATADEVAALPPELQCGALGNHIFMLTNGPDGKYTAFKRMVAANPERITKIDEMAVAFRKAAVTECEQRPWSVEHRRCVAGSQTNSALDQCH